MAIVQADSTSVPWRLSASGLQAAYAAGRLDPRDVLRSVLARLAEVNPKLNAVVLVDEARAQAAATASAERWRAGRPLSPLDGVPVTVKDNIPVGGLRATWGSRLFAEHVAPDDEIAVARLRAAGAVIWAKTNTPELAMAGITDNLLFGPTRNPWNLDRTPGGSSGGAAAAVAAGAGPLAVATDAGGSIRRPACYCGLIGIRPSTGRVARLPGVGDAAFPPLAGDSQVIGPIARSVADALMLLRAIGLPDARDRASLALAPLPDPLPPAPRPARIRLVAAIPGHPCAAAESAAAEAAGTALARLGHAVELGPALWDPEEMNALFGTIVAGGVARVVRRHPDWAERTTPIIRGIAEAGLKLSAPDYVDAIDRIAGLRARAAADLAGIEAILSPASATLPWEIGAPFPAEIDGRKAGPRAGGAFSTFVNLLGLPAVALPGPVSPEGLPAGVQLAGRFGSDATVIALAAELEAALWPEGLPRPPAFA
ncbi:MAG: amidase [Alphaproteobacteria bacterium]|nr:amidase [Alphaproteobacteria bacterium]